MRIHSCSHMRGRPHPTNKVFSFLFLLHTLCLFQVKSEGTETVKDEILLNDVMNWVRMNGAYINEKVQIREMEGGLSGLFTSEPMEKGELISSVPWNITLKGDDGSDDNEAWCNTFWAVHSALSKDESLKTPYEKYLSAPPRRVRSIPSFWSDQGKKILKDICSDVIPIRYLFQERTVWESYGCQINFQDELAMDAAMIANARWEDGKRGTALVPFNDLINHRNGKWINTRSRNMESDNFEFYTTRRVEANEELFYSYTQCDYCADQHDDPPGEDLFLVTPYLFFDYGFVQPTPQRWVFPKVRLLFDIDEGEDGKLQVNFVVPPSHSGISFARAELVRLEKFMKEFEESNSKTELPENEVNGIMAFYNAVLDAFTLVSRTGDDNTSEDVWVMGGLRGSGSQKEEWYNKKYHPSLDSSNSIESKTAL